jgi:MerR family transcriptional regulator, redox-sensitive transcriptional activator SoxR
MADGDADGGNRLTIGEVARRSGLRTSAIRYYEQEELLPAPARSSGRRSYSGEVFTALAVIRLAQEAGFSISEIRKLMTGFGDEPASARWRSLAKEKLVEVEAMIERGQAIKALLEEGVRCGCLRLEDCKPLERFQSPG